MKLFYCGLLLLCPSLGNAQALGVGDKLPDMELDNMTNYTSNKALISQLTKKITLVEFWNTWCGACIAKFPMLDSMQKANPSSLGVLLVLSRGKDKPERVDKIFRHLKAVDGGRLKLPLLLQDTVLSTLFPNHGVPHYIWLNEERKVIAITGTDEVTPANINAALKTNTARYAVKEGYGLYDRDVPLFINNNAGNGEAMLYRSILYPKISGVGSGSNYKKNKAGLVTKVTLTNSSLKTLVQQAYEVALPPNRIIMDLPVEQPPTYYVYELVTPPVTTAQARLLMQEDFKRFFGVTGKMDSIPSDCYLFMVDSLKLKAYATKGGKPKTELSDFGGRYMQNSPVKKLADYLDFYLPVPVLYDQLPSFKVDLALSDETGLNIALLQKELAVFGITLVPAVKPIPRFIINQLPKKGLL